MPSSQQSEAACCTALKWLLLPWWRGPWFRFTFSMRWRVTWGRLFRGFFKQLSGLVGGKDGPDSESLVFYMICGVMILVFSLMCCLFCCLKSVMDLLNTLTCGLFSTVRTTWRPWHRKYIDSWWWMWWMVKWTPKRNKLHEERVQMDWWMETWAPFFKPVSRRFPYKPIKLCPWLLNHWWLTSELSRHLCLSNELSFECLNEQGTLL